MSFLSIRPGKMQFLPMNPDRHFDNRTIREIQKDFIEGTLLADGGRYLYNRPGIEFKEDTIVLFQYANRIIGVAMLENCRELDRANGGFTDEYTFDRGTVMAVEPISSEKMRKELPWDEFPGYGREKRIVPEDKISPLLELLARKRNRYLLNLEEGEALGESPVDGGPGDPGEDRPEAVPPRTGGQRGYQYAPDPGKSDRAKRRANYRCEIGGDHPTFIYSRLSYLALAL